MKWININEININHKTATLSNLPIKSYRSTKSLNFVLILLHNNINSDYNTFKPINIIVSDAHTEQAYLTSKSSFWNSITSFCQAKSLAFISWFFSVQCNPIPSTRCFQQKKVEKFLITTDTKRTAFQNAILHARGNTISARMKLFGSSKTYDLTSFQ